MVGHFHIGANQLNVKRKPKKKPKQRQEIFLSTNLNKKGLVLYVASLLREKYILHGLISRKGLTSLNSQKSIRLVRPNYS